MTHILGEIHHHIPPFITQFLEEGKKRKALKTHLQPNYQESLDLDPLYKITARGADGNNSCQSEGLRRTWFKVKEPFPVPGESPAHPAPTLPAWDSSILCFQELCWYPHLTQPQRLFPLSVAESPPDAVCNTGQGAQRPPLTPQLELQNSWTSKDWV